MNPDSRPRSAGSVRRPQASAASARKGRLRERFRAETRDAILAAAERALAERGVGGAKMEVIARLAGIAVGTLYNYFADRQELIDALFEVRRAELITRLDQALDAAAGAAFERRLEAFLGAGLAHFQAHREFIALALHDELSSGQGSRWSMLLELRARAERLVAGGIDSGLLRPEDRATYPHMLAGLLKGLIETAMAAKDASDDVLPSRLLAPAVRCFLQGARRVA